MKLTRIFALAWIAAFAGIFAAGPALAQKAPATKSSTAKTSTKPAAPKKSTAKKAGKKKSTAKKSTSPCVGLQQRACTTNKVCGWIKPKKKVSTDGRKLTAYCRKVAGIGKKKAAKKSAAKEPASNKTAAKKTAAKKAKKTT